MNSRFLTLAVVAGVLAVWPLSRAVVGQTSAPAISSISGSWVQKGTITIQGSGFGTKPTAAPLVWDDCSGTNVLDLWDGAWPAPTDSTQYQMTYRTPFDGVNPPHNRVGKYLSGGHGCANGLACEAVLVWKNRTFSQGAVSYLSWYQRFDPAWVFGQDNNEKLSSWGTAGPYGNPFWYSEYNATFTSATGTGSWHVNGVPGGGGSIWGEAATNPFQQWVKVEMLVRWSTQSDGFVQIYDNGRQVINYSGATDYGSGTSRAETIGGYARQYGVSPNNWRYFADLYVDSSLAHIVIGNASTLAASTKREIQIPVSWSSSSITATVNLGAFPDGGPFYLYVVNPDGTVNAAGYPVSGQALPPAPTNIRIIK